MTNDAQDPRDITLDRGHSTLDQRFRFVYNYIWQLPFFRTVKGSRGVALGGWSLNGIVQLTFGFPKDRREDN